MFKINFKEITDDHTLGKYIYVRINSDRAHNEDSKPYKSRSIRRSWKMCSSHKMGGSQWNPASQQYHFFNWGG